MKIHPTGLMSAAVAVLLLFLAASCSGRQHTIMTTVSNEQADSVSAGLWGGDQISMEVTGSGASIEYGCAHGSINQPIKLDGNGNFSVRGTHVKERPGPVREGESGGVQVTYTGHVDGTTMTLTVTATANKQTIGTYTLTHGKRSRVFKCQ